MLAPWKKSRDITFNRSPSQGYGFSSSHVWMWDWDHNESWALKNWCFWTVMLEKILESPLDSKEIQPAHPKGLKAGEGDDRGWDGRMATPTHWTWIWVSSGSWWWTGVLQSMGSQRVGHDWATELKYIIDQSKSDGQARIPKNGEIRLPLLRTYRIAQQTRLSDLWGPEWEGALKRVDVCMGVAASLCFMAETDTALQTSCAPIERQRDEEGLWPSTDQSQSRVFAWNVFSWSTVSFCWFGFLCCCWAASSCGFFTDLCLCVLLFNITENVLQRGSRVSPVFNKIMKYQIFKTIAFWWCKCKKSELMRS